MKYTSAVNFFSMREALDRYYSLFIKRDIYSIAKMCNLRISNIIEAGCHDGKDTVELHAFFKPNQILAFEPDEVAPNKAIKLIEQQKIENIEIYSVGLSNTDGHAYLKFEAEGPGSGSTHLSHYGDIPVSFWRFDDHFELSNQVALLWLDVEGHTLQALQGMQRALSNVVLAKIEVQLHTRNEEFKEDLFKVVKIMKKASLIPIYGPIHPSYFGDVIFVHKKNASREFKIRSKVLIAHLFLLHKVAYPALGKLPRL